MATHTLLTAIQFAVVPVATDSAPAPPEGVAAKKALDEDELWSDTHDPSDPTVGRVRTFVADEEVTNTYLFTSDAARVEFEPSASAEMDCREDTDALNFCL